MFRFLFRCLPSRSSQRDLTTAKKNRQRRKKCFAFVMVFWSCLARCDLERITLSLIFFSRSLRGFFSPRSSSSSAANRRLLLAVACFDLMNNFNRDSAHTCRPVGRTDVDADSAKLLFGKTKSDRGSRKEQATMISFCGLRAIVGSIKQQKSFACRSAAVLIKYRSIA